MRNLDAEGLKGNRGGFASGDKGQDRVGPQYAEDHFGDEAVASAKLRKAQKAIEGMRPYERTLAEILAAVRTGESSPPSTTPAHDSPVPGKTAIIAIASNSSLCGAFNANVVRKALETIRACEGEVEVIPVGRKMAEALRRAGYAHAGDFNDVIGHPSYEKSAGLARSLSERYLAGELSRVVLVYNRFISSARQEPVAEVYLPFGMAESSSRADRNYFSDKFAENQFRLRPPQRQRTPPPKLPSVTILSSNRMQRRWWRSCCRR